MGAPLDKLQYSLKIRNASSSIITIFKGQNFVSYFGSVIWNSVPVELREINSFQVFRSEVNAWRPRNCPRRLCKNYIENLVFVNIAS